MKKEEGYDPLHLTRIIKGEGEGEVEKKDYKRSRGFAFLMYSMEERVQDHFTDLASDRSALF